MTSTKYIVYLVAHAFGYRRKNARMGEAATETHLLKEAESHLGKAIWEKVEPIEAVSLEYWSLRKLIKERDRVAAELDGCQKTLADAQEERMSLLGISNEPFQDLIDQRQSIISSLEELARERDDVVAKARELRRSYDGFKTKEEVLTKEENHTKEEFADITKRLAELKLVFSSLKEERQKVAQKIDEGDAKIDEIENEIQKRKNERRERAAEAFQQISHANQEMSTLRAELGVIDTQMRQLFTEIGKYVSRCVSEDAQCRAACKEHKGLVDVMKALRRSIMLNHKLAENQ